MNYKELKEILELKKISISELCNTIGYTRAGLQRALDNQTIELRKLKLICETVRISPALFFENGSFGIIQNSTTENKNELHLLQNENELLREQIRDKNEIISLYKEKNNPYYDIVAAPPVAKLSTNYEKKKK